MMEWALPTPARMRFEAIEKEFATRADVQPFLKGAIWRGFMAKYPESNLLQKKMLHVSAKIRRLALSRRRGSNFHEARRELNRFCCARNATMLIGMEFLAAFIRRICGRRRGARWWRLRPLRMGWRIAMPVGRNRNGAISMRMGARKFVLRRRIIRRCCARRMAGRSARWTSGRRM